MSWRLVNEIRGLPWRDFAREAWHSSFIVAKVLCFLHVTTNYVSSFVLPMGPSMLPTFNISGDVLVADKLSTRFGKIKRGDLVLVRSPQNPRKTVCKRVTGVEGDSVDFYKTDCGEQNQHVVVPKGHIWVEGDNLPVSNDSRNYGPVPCALIEGKIFLRVWPIEGFGFLK